MAEGIDVRFAGTLQQFIQQRVGGSGLYSSASEYIRDLVRRDYEREEERKSEFLPLDADEFLQKAKARRTPHGS